MPSVSHRLDRFIVRRLCISHKAVRALIVKGKIVVDGEIASIMNQAVGPFTLVVVDGNIVQQRQPIYLMMNKPKGVVSATKDTQHTTVMDLINHPLKDQLHIAGRLDFNTTGLLLLTNDGEWSKQLSLPDNGVKKTYRVTVKEPLLADVIHQYRQAFAQGIPLTPENITTRPATFTVLDDHTVELTICEGRYHQVKRMFGFFQNEVLELHRLSVGHIALDNALALGESRMLIGETVALPKSVSL
jgi:16S rRNA pseudouridine516 synthase